MGLLFVEVLPRDATGGAEVLQCRRCRVDAASVGAILSRDFQGRIGSAYLFDHVVNITLGPNENRNFRTGLHTVNDISCICCQEVLGWRYAGRFVTKHEPAKLATNRFCDFEATLELKQADRKY